MGGDDALAASVPLAAIPACTAHSAFIQSANLSLAVMRWLETTWARWTGIVRKHCSERSRVAPASKTVLHAWAFALVIGFAGVPVDAAADPQACFSPWEIQEAIAQGKAIEPKAALQVARRLAPGADVMRGRLCRAGGALVYQILVLRKDGRLIQVTIDAPSGKVLSLE